MSFDRNILLSVVLHLAILFSPLATKIAHHHILKHHHETHQPAFSSFQGHCHICDFEYLPYLQTEFPANKKINHAGSIIEIHDTEKIYFNSFTVVSLRAPPVV